MRSVPQITKNIFAAAALLVCAFVHVSAAQQKLRQTSGTKSDQQLAQAMTAITNGDLDQADTILRKLLVASPRDVKAQTLAGIVADRRGDSQEAEKHFAAAAQLSPVSADTRNNYGAILLRLGKSKEASREFETSLKINPNQLSALVNLARIKFDAGDLAAAGPLFEKARSIKNDPDISRALLTIALRLKQVDRARTAYQEYASFQPAAGADDDRIEMATMLLEVGLSAEAIAQLQSVLSTSPGNIGAMTALSRAYLAQKNIPAAGKLLESAVAGGIDDARVYAALADVYQAGGYFENAIPAMRNAIAKAPENLDYRYRYGLLLVDSKAPAAAIIRLGEYVKQYPGAAKLWLALGIAYVYDGKSSEAATSFEKALELEPKMLPALAYLANTYTEAARYGEAAKVYENAIEISGGKQPIFQYLLADTLLNVSDADQKRIEALLKQATGLDADFGSAYSALATLYARQQRWVEAAAAFENAIRIDPDDTKSLYQLSRVYARLKKNEQSQAAIEKFKRLTAEEKERKEIDRRDLVRRLADVRF